MIAHSSILRLIAPLFWLENVNIRPIQEVKYSQKAIFVRRIISIHEVEILLVERFVVNSIMDGVPEMWRLMVENCRMITVNVNKHRMGLESLKFIKSLFLVHIV